MSDPAKKPATDPWSAYLPTDWNKVSWAHALSQAPRALPGSIRRDVPQIVAPLLPKNWESDASTAKALALGLGSRFTPARYFETPAQRRKLEAPLDAVGDYYRKRYMTAPGLKEAIATDPFGVGLDVSAVAGVPAGTEGAAARVPGAVGKAAQATTGTARVLRDLANPVPLAGKAVSATAGAARRVWRGPIMDRTGAFSPEVTAAIKQAFPNGAIGDQALADPAFRQALTQTLQAKGVSPAAVKEAVLAYHGAPAPRSLVTGKVAPNAVADTTRALVDQGRSRLGSVAKALAGSEGAPSNSALGAALQDAHLASKNGYQTAYKQAFSHDGAFTPDFVTGLPDQISAALKKSDLPTTPEDLAKYPSLKQSQAALDWLHPHLADLAGNDDLTLPNLERARQELGQLRQTAKGTDRRAVGAIIEGLDKHIQNEAAGGQFFPPSGLPRYWEPSQLRNVNPATSGFLDPHPGPLNRYADVLYRETSPRSAAAMTPGSHISDSLAVPTYLTNDPAFALGQGENKGALLEYDAGGLHGYADFRKPASQHLLANGSAEFNANLTGQQGAQKALRAVRLPEDITANADVGLDTSLLARSLRSLEGNGWVKSDRNGFVEWRRPDTIPKADPEHGMAVATDMKAARDAYKAHQANFASRANSTDSTITRAIREFADQGVDEDGLATPARGGSEQAAQSVLTNALINPKTLVVKPGADKLYGKLSDLLGPEGQRALQDHIRQTVLATNDDGHLLANSDRLGNFLDSPLAEKTYSPDELSKVRLLGAASDVLGTRPHIRTENLSEATGPILGGIAGYGAAKMMGAPGELGAGVGVATEKPFQMIKEAGQRRAEKKGASPDLPGLRGLEGAGDAAAAAGRLAPVTNAETEARQALDKATQPAPPKAANEQPPVPVANEDTDWSQYLKPPEAAEQADGGRIERKDGGRIDDRTEALVKRLLAAHAKARSQTKAATKPLLNVPDEHVAHALDIAQQAI